MELFRQKQELFDRKRELLRASSDQYGGKPAATPGPEYSCTGE
jgi:hypothetical protein